MKLLSCNHFLKRANARKGAIYIYFMAKVS